MYNSTSIRSSGDIDPSTNPALTGPENTTPGVLAGFCQSLLVYPRLLIIFKVSTKNKSDGGEDHEVEEEDEFGEVEDDSEPDLEGDPSNFEVYVKTSFQLIHFTLHYVYRVGSRGRVANPVAGSKSIRSK